MYLLILCILTFWPVIIMFFMLFCSHHLQMAGACCTVQSEWCASHSQHVTEGTYSVDFEIPNYT